MEIFRHLLALVLALQIVNPLCHCVGTECSPNPEPTQQTSSCCQSTEAGAQKNKTSHTGGDGESLLCMCPKEPNLSHDVKNELPSEPHLFELLTPALIEIPDSITIVAQAHPLMLSEFLPPGPTRRVLFASFLI